MSRGIAVGIALLFVVFCHQGGLVEVGKGSLALVVVLDALVGIVAILSRALCKFEDFRRFLGPDGESDSR